MAGTSNGRTCSTGTKSRRSGFSLHVSLVHAKLVQPPELGKARDKSPIPDIVRPQADCGIYITDNVLVSVETLSPYGCKNCMTRGQACQNHDNIRGKSLQGWRIPFAATWTQDFREETPKLPANPLACSSDQASQASTNATQAEQQ